MTKPPITRKLRCAVYTRKSSEEGLEQEFNSLHAQREACEAYVASQRSEGWALIREPYDDGGAIARIMPEGGWSRKRFADARQYLIERGLLVELCPAIKGVGPAEYKFRVVDFDHQ